MAKRVGFYKYRYKEKRHIVADLALMTAAVTVGVFAVMITFELAWPGLLNVSEPRQLRGVAPAQNIAQQAAQQQAIQVQNLLARDEVEIGVEKYDGYAYLGQQDVSFLRFSLNPSRDAKLMQLRFRLDGYARPSDVKSLQLYYEKKLVAQVPFFEAQGVFDGLNIRLKARATASFEVKGNISEEAFSGDRVQIGFQDSNDIVVRDEEMNDMGIGGNFPLWGGYVSLIGNRKSP